ncbi:hypothetical protein O181_074207 [Austropuccinia psidii MF-1]|uniref:Uncharacterized protein n=1 Tax=Austropuccinia psidii MF-1 TaxID=1389203 RepID=A0A9Q3IBR4_9BASI|nr:hypothetical protein [Austropuccinia psidii MF-1]
MPSTIDQPTHSDWISFPLPPKSVLHSVSYSDLSNRPFKHPYPLRSISENANSVHIDLMAFRHSVEQTASFDTISHSSNQLNTKFDTHLINHPIETLSSSHGRARCLSNYPSRFLNRPITACASKPQPAFSSTRLPSNFPIGLSNDLAQKLTQSYIKPVSYIPPLPTSNSQVPSNLVDSSHQINSYPPKIIAHSNLHIPPQIIPPNTSHPPPSRDSSLKPLSPSPNPSIPLSSFQNSNTHSSTISLIPKLVKKRRRIQQISLPANTQLDLRPYSTKPQNPSPIPHSQSTKVPLPQADAISQSFKLINQRASSQPTKVINKSLTTSDSTISHLAIPSYHLSLPNWGDDSILASHPSLIAPLKLLETDPEILNLKLEIPLHPGTFQKSIHHHTQSPKIKSFQKDKPTKENAINTTRRKIEKFKLKTKTFLGFHKAFL